MAAAPVSSAKGVSDSSKRCGSGQQARPGALFWWMGPHAADCGSVQTAAWPLLQNHGGEENESDTRLDQEILARILHTSQVFLRSFCSFQSFY